MATAAAPDREARRAPDRRCALRRTVVLGGLFLVLAAGCFCILFYALRVRSERVWESAVTEALTRGDDVAAAALLRRARTEAPHTAQSARFVALETRLFALQERKQSRRTAFRERLEKLERMLNEEPRRAISALEIAELARLAPDETALERVRRLRLRLDARRELAATRQAQQLLNELKKLQNFYRAMAAARRSGQPLSAAWQEADAKLAELKLEVRDHPELGETFRMTEELAETERAARREAAERGKRRDRAFAAILHSDTPADAKIRCAVFLKEFSDDPAAPHVRRLQQDLAWCERSFAEAVTRRQTRLREAENQALRRCRQLLRELAEDAAADDACRNAARDLVMEADRLTASDTAGFLARLLGEKEEIPEKLREALHRRLPEAARLLIGNDPAPTAAEALARFRLHDEFLKACRETRPRFAGIRAALPGAAPQFHPAPDLRDRAEAWIPGDNDRFVRIGEIHHGNLFPAAAGVPEVRAVFLPDGPLATPEKRAPWLIRAAETGLAALPWPDFWPEDCRN